MGRTLPWKQTVDRADAKRTSSNRTSPSARLGTPPDVRASAKSVLLTSSSRPRPHTVSAKPKSDSGLSSSSDQDSDHKEAPEAPSTPRQPKPVSESLMIPGLHNDDKWRMVEDEFVAVAHKFTAHLHAAEYKRLKQRVKEQNADAIRSISRPVTGPMTDNVKRRHAALSLRGSQSKGLKRALSRGNDADEDDADDLPWAGTNLQELMNSPRKKPVSLTRMVSAVSGTRAAALSRQHSTARNPASLGNTKPSRGSSGNGTGQAGSPFTARTTSARTQDQDGSGDDDLAGSSSRHLAPGNVPRPRSTTSGQTSAKATSAPAHKGTSVPVNSTLDDSDSPVETMFDWRARRHKRNARRRTTSSTPDAAATNKDDSELSHNSQSRQIQTALSIPSWS